MKFASNLMVLIFTALLAELCYADIGPIEAQAARFAAMLQMDQDALTDLLSEELHYSHSNGRVETKSEFINTVMSKRIQYVSIERRNVQARVDGVIATVTGSIEVKFLFRGEEVFLHNKFLEVARMESGIWKLYAWQTARMQQ